MKMRQILVHRDMGKGLKLDLQYNTKVTPIVLDVKKGQCITVNVCNAAEKIKNYPETIQKLVWRALHYKCEVNTRQPTSSCSHEDYMMFTEYVEAFRHAQQLIMKMCKSLGLGCIIIEGGI
jgi:hypothetical protein